MVVARVGRPAALDARVPRMRQPVVLERQLDCSRVTPGTSAVMT